MSTLSPLPSSINVLASPNKQTKKQTQNSRRVQIHHVNQQQSLFNEEHKDHQINKAISMCNAVVRLIFKNTKDSQAISLGSGGKVEVPKNKAPEEQKKFQDLSKIVK